MEDVIGAKTSNHPKKGELSYMEEGREGEIATKKVDNRFWSGFVELLEPLKVYFVVVLQDVLLCLAEDTSR